MDSIKVDLNKVSLVESSSKIIAFIDPKKIEVIHKIQKTDYTIYPPESDKNIKGALVCHIGFLVEGVAAEDIKNTQIKKNHSIFKISATYESVYFTEMKEITKDEAKSFSDTHVIPHIVPYFREFITGMSSKMNIPPITVPLFKGF